MATYSASPTNPPVVPISTKSKPMGWTPGEEKFHVNVIPHHLNLNADSVRGYAVYGITDWQKGPHAAKLNLARSFVLDLVVRDGQMVAEAEVLLYPHQAKKAGAPEPERGVTLKVQLSKPDEEKELRRAARNVLRFGAWASKRLGPALEKYLNDLVAKPSDDTWLDHWLEEWQSTAS